MGVHFGTYLNIDLQSAEIFYLEGASLLYRYLLIVRFTLINVVAISFLATAYLQGWLDSIIDAYLKELSLGICLVFLYGLGLCGYRVWINSVDINNVKAGRLDSESQISKYLQHAATADAESRSIQFGALRLKLTDKVASIRHVANSLILLGLIGTVIGFIIALSGIDPVEATDVEKVAGMISTLINGMSVALNTTLVGSVLYVWLTINYRILVTGTVDLISAIIEAGEVSARS